MRHTIFISFVVTGFLFTNSAFAKSESDFTAMIKKTQAESKTTKNKEDIQKLSDEFLAKMKADKRQGETEFPGDLFSGKAAFPGDLFDLNESLRTQTDWLVKRAKKDKRARAVYDMDSTYREDLAQLGEKASLAARSLQTESPETATEYAKISKQLLSSLMTQVEQDDIKGQSLWLRDISSSIEKIAVLRKKPAR